MSAMPIERYQAKKLLTTERDNQRGYSIVYKQVVLAFLIEIIIVITSLIGAWLMARGIPISPNDCGNWDSPACQASPLSSKLLLHSLVPSMGMFESVENALTSARWRSMPPPIPWHP